MCARHARRDRGDSKLDTCREMIVRLDYRPRDRISDSIDETHAGIYIEIHLATVL